MQVTKAIPPIINVIQEDINSSQDLYDNTGLDDVRDDLDGYL